MKTRRTVSENPSMNAINLVREQNASFYPMSGSRTAAVRLAYIRSDGMIGYWDMAEGNVILDLPVLEEMMSGRQFIVGFQNNLASSSVEQALVTGHSNKPERVEAVKEQLRQWAAATGAALSEAEIERRELVQRNGNAAGIHVLLEDEGTALHIPTIHLPALLMKRMCKAAKINYRHLRVSATNVEYGTKYEELLPEEIPFGDAWEVQFAINRPQDAGLWAPEIDGAVQIVVTIYREGEIVCEIVASPSVFFQTYIARDLETEHILGNTPDMPPPSSGAGRMVSRVVNFADEAVEKAVSFKTEEPRKSTRNGSGTRNTRAEVEDEPRPQTASSRHRAPKQPVDDDENIPF